MPKKTRIEFSSDLLANRLEGLLMSQKPLSFKLTQALVEIKLCARYHRENYNDLEKVSELIIERDFPEPPPNNNVMRYSGD